MTLRFPVSHLSSDVMGVKIAVMNQGKGEKWKILAMKERPWLLSGSVVDAQLLNRHLKHDNLFRTLHLNAPWERFLGPDSSDGRGAMPLYCLMQLPTVSQLSLLEARREPSLARSLFCACFSPAALLFPVEEEYRTELEQKERAVAIHRHN